MQSTAQTSPTPEPEPRLKTILKTYFAFLLLPELPDSPGQALTKRLPAQENSR